MKSLLIGLLLFVAAGYVHAKWIDMVVAYDDDYTDGYTNGTEMVDGRRWSYQVRGDSVAIRRVSPAGGAVAVPQVLAGKPVTVIADSAFLYCTEITSISIPESVTNIERRAFFGCSGLGSGVIISDGCVLCVNGACPNTVVLPEGVRLIAGGAFSDVTNITSISLPASVENIGDYAFSGCVGINEYCVSSDNVAYKVANGLLVSEDGKTLVGAINASFVNVPYGVERIPDHMFRYYDLVKSVEIPSTVKIIERDAFYGCSRMESVVISEGVEAISSYAFSSCCRLVSVRIPSTVETIGDRAFSECIGLESFSVASGNDRYKSVDGMLCSYDGRELIAGLNRTTVVIPHGIESIRNGAFKGYCDIESVSVPPSVTNFDEYAFCECSCLSQINIPGSVMHIGAYAFDDCWSLGGDIVVIDGWALVCNDEYSSYVEIPEGVRHMVDGLFSSMYSLEFASLPSSLEEIPDGAFCFCDILSQIDMSQNVGRIGDAAFMDCGCLAEVVIPSGVTNIGCWAFSSCNELSSMVVPDGVVSLGEYAISYCANLSSVSLPASAIDISDTVLYGCYNLQDVTLPGWDCGIKYASFTSLTISEGTREIAAGSFIFNTSLQSVRIPSSVQRIGVQAFYGCTGLGSGIVIVDGCVICVNGSCPSVVELAADVRVIGAGIFTGRGDTKQYIVNQDNPYLRTIDGMICTKDGGTLLVGVNRKGVTIPSTVTNIADRAFEGCRDIVGIRIPTNVVDLGEFAFCESGLLAVEIDNGISVLKTGVFSGVDLASVSIPTSVREIDDFAFGYLFEGGLQWVYVDVGDTERVGALYEWPTGRPGWPFKIVERVRGNCPVAVPTDWKTLYDGFELNFGSDLEAALMKTSGKKDCAGNDMYVWQDYVAGTDPTDPYDKFVASVTVVDGDPVVSWTPVLSPEQAALRRYTVYGKTKLHDAAWSVVSGDEANYNFFKVTVEMR